MDPLGLNLLIESEPDQPRGCKDGPDYLSIVNGIPRKQTAAELQGYGSKTQGAGPATHNGRNKMQPRVHRGD